MIESIIKGGTVAAGFICVLVGALILLRFGGWEAWALGVAAMGVGIAAILHALAGTHP